MNRDANIYIRIFILYQNIYIRKCLYLKYIYNIYIRKYILLDIYIINIYLYLYQKFIFLNIYIRKSCTIILKNTIYHDQVGVTPGMQGQLTFKSQST